MGLKLTGGVYPLSVRGFPQETQPEEELLQNITMRLTMLRGRFPYDRELGSRLGELSSSTPHAAEQAVSLANEALLDLPGVRATLAEFLNSGRKIRFYLETPYGEELVTVTPVR